MPELDGLEATAEIRRREGEHGRRLPMAMTARAQDGDRERCLEGTQRGGVVRSLRRVAANEARAEERPCEALPCDLDELARNYDDDPDTIRSLLEMFLPRATELVARMQRAARQGDHEALRRDAHALRGISGTVRAQRLFARLEPDRDATELDLSALAHELGQVRDYLERELGLRAPA